MHMAFLHSSQYIFCIFYLLCMKLLYFDFALHGKLYKIFSQGNIIHLHKVMPELFAPHFIFTYLVSWQIKDVKGETKTKMHNDYNRGVCEKRLPHCNWHTLCLLMDMPFSFKHS